MAATFTRVPFGELGASRLQALESAKNRQNAITESIKAQTLGRTMSPKDSLNQLASPTKRSASIFEEDNSDSENLDPVVFLSPKRSKVEASSLTSPKASVFSLAVEKPVTPMNLAFTSPLKRKQATPESCPSAINSIISPTSPRHILPVKHKRVGALTKSRASSASPFKRVDPPVKSSAGSIPFSIDAALTGTLSYAAPKTPKVSKVQKGQAKGWFFEIHEDTPDESLAIELQHSTSTIDLSSDDEQAPSQKRLKRGKENIPPTEDEAMAADVDALRPRSRKADAMTDDGDRSPLSDLAPEDYFANGLDATSVVVVSDGPADAAELVANDVATEEPLPESPLDASNARAVPMVPAPTSNDFTFVIAEDSDVERS